MRSSRRAPLPAPGACLLVSLAVFSLLAAVLAQAPVAQTGQPAQQGGPSTAAAIAAVAQPNATAQAQATPAATGTPDKTATVAPQATVVAPQAKPAAKPEVTKKVEGAYDHFSNQTSDPGQGPVRYKAPADVVTSFMKRQKAKKVGFVPGATQPGVVTPAEGDLCACNAKSGAPPCDFHFLGFQDKVTTIRLAGTDPRLAISPPIAVTHNKTSLLVLIQGAGNAVIEPCRSATSAETARALDLVQNQLFFMSAGHTRLFRSNFQMPDMNALHDMCVRVPVGKVKLLPDPRVEATQNGKVTEPQIAADRHCLMFRTAL